MRATRSVQFILLDMITLLIVGKNTNYEARHYAVFSIPVTSFLGPNILLSTLF
jgi:hypothetical protein